MQNLGLLGPLEVLFPDQDTSHCWNLYVIYRNLLNFLHCLLLKLLCLPYWYVINVCIKCTSLPEKCPPKSPCTLTPNLSKLLNPQKHLSNYRVYLITCSNKGGNYDTLYAATNVALVCVRRWEVYIEFWLESLNEETTSKT